MPVYSKFQQLSLAKNRLFSEAHETGNYVKKRSPVVHLLTEWGRLIEQLGLILLSHFYVSINVRRYNINL